VVVAREEFKQPFQNTMVIGIKIFNPDEAAALSGRQFILELTNDLRQLGFRVDRLVAPDYRSVILINTDMEDGFHFRKDMPLGFWSDPRDYPQRNFGPSRHGSSMKSISSMLKFIEQDTFPKLGTGISTGWSPLGYLLRFGKFLRMYIPGVSDDDLGPSAMVTLFFHGLTPAATKIYEPYREHLMGLQWDNTKYGYRTWQNPDFRQNPGWLSNSFQGAAISIAFTTFGEYVDNADMLSSAMISTPHGSIKTIANFHEECSRLERIDSWSKVGAQLPGDGTHSYRSLIDRSLDKEVKNLLRQTEYFSGQYDPYFDRLSSSRPWQEYYPGLERVLMMYQAASNPTKVRLETPSPSIKFRPSSVGVHMIGDTEENPDQTQIVFNFEDIKKIQNEHSTKLENLQVQLAQVLHATTVPKVLHTPTSSGPLRAFGTAGTPIPPRVESTSTTNLQSASQRDDRGEHRESSTNFPREPRPSRYTPPNRPTARNDRDRRSSSPPPARRSTRPPVPNRDLLAFLQQTAQQEDIWSEEVSDLIAITTAHLQSAHLLDDSSSDSDN